MLRAELHGSSSSDSSITHTQFASLSVKSKQIRYGTAQGLPGSQERQGQRRQLKRVNYPELRRLPRFVQRSQDWGRWFDNLATDTTVFNALLAKINIENTEALANLTQGQTYVINTRCRPPTGWEGGDEWRCDSDLSLAALSELMAEMRGRRSPVPPAEQRRRGQLGLERRYNHDLYYIGFFINKTLRVDINGKIHCRAYMDDFRDSKLENEGIYVGRRYAGNCILDLDPDISIHALVSLLFSYLFVYLFIYF